MSCKIAISLKVISLLSLLKCRGHEHEDPTMNVLKSHLVKIPISLRGLNFMVMICTLSLIKKVYVNKVQTQKSSGKGVLFCILHNLIWKIKYQILRKTHFLLF